MLPRAAEGEGVDTDPGILGILQMIGAHKVAQAGGKNDLHLVFTLFEQARDIRLTKITYTYRVKTSSLKEGLLLHEKKYEGRVEEGGVK